MRHRRILAALAGGALVLPRAVSAQEVGSGMFSLNFGLTIWTGIVFLILLGILWRFAWGPILGAVEARESGIQETLDRAKAEREAAAELLAEHKRQMADARRQGQQ